MSAESARVDAARNRKLGRTTGDRLVCRECGKISARDVCLECDPEQGGPPAREPVATEQTGLFD